MRKFIVLLTVCVAFIATLPIRADAPPPVDSVAESWLDRVEKDLATPSKNLGMNLADAQKVAMELYRCEPTDERRKLVCDLAETEDKSRGVRLTGAAKFYEAALVCARVGDADRARKDLQTADELSKADTQPATRPAIRPSTRPANRGGSFGPAVYDRTEIEWYLGNHEPAKSKGVSVGRLLVLDRKLDADGRKAEAHEVADLVLARLTDPANLSRQVGGPSRAMLLRMLIADFVRCGDLKTAERLAGSDEGLTPDDQPTNKNQRRFQSQLVISTVAADVKNRDAIASARSEMFQLLKEFPEEPFCDFPSRRNSSRFVTDSGLPEFCRICAESGDRGDFDEAAAALSDRLDRDEKSAGDGADIGVRIMLARSAAVAGASDLCKTQLETIERQLALPIENAPTARAKQALTDARAKRFLDLAAIRARIGDEPGVADDTDRSKSTAVLGDSDWDLGWQSVVEAYADAHEFDKAKQAMANLRNRRFGFLVSYITLKQAEAGDFAAAWSGAALSSDPSLRYRIAVLETRAGHQKEVVPELEKVSDPLARAEIEIGAADALLDRVPAGDQTPFGSVNSFGR